jgi:AcrR family transcriptional regulator
VTDTRQRLLDGAVATLRDKGIAGTSARAIAATAGVNQALIFYHFGSVDGLLDAACRDATAALVGRYRDRLGAAGSLRDLLAAGRELHARERESGDVAMLAQLLAGAQRDERLAVTCRDCLALWVAEIEAVLQRLLAGHPLGEVAEEGGLARAVSAAFIGIELYDGVDAAGAAAAFAALESLAVLAEVADDLGPIATRAVRARLRRAVGNEERREREESL